MTDPVAVTGPVVGTVTFANDRGQLLSAIYDLPQGPVTATALFAHCFTCSKQTRATARVTRALTAHGIAVLRFDFTGLGDSQGDFVDQTFSSSVADVVAAAAWMREYARAPSLLVGHSLGGAAVLAAAHAIPESRAVVTIGAPADTVHAQGLLGAAADLAEPDGTATIQLGGRTVTVGRDLVRDLAQQPQQQRIAGLRRALLIMHSPVDEVVSIDNAQAVYTAARHPKSFVAIPGASHLLDDDADARYVADVIAAWSSRYVESDMAVPERPAAARPTIVSTSAEPLEAGVVEVTESGAGRFGQVIRAGRHVWLADEPATLDGAVDSGPTPYDHLLAAIGTCTAMTIRMYADRKGWPLDHVSVTLRQDQVHADDCDATTEEAVANRLAESGPPVQPGVEIIRRDIRIDGTIDERRRARLIEIAERCPVHRTLQAGIRIVTRGVD